MKKQTKLVIKKILKIVLIIVSVLIVGMCFYIYYINNYISIHLEYQNERDAFNSNLMLTQGENKNLQYVKSVMIKVLYTNSIYEERQIKINNNSNIQEMISKASSLTSGYYNITMDMDDEGYIVNINITNSKGEYILVDN